MGLETIVLFTVLGAAQLSFFVNFICLCTGDINAIANPEGRDDDSDDDDDDDDSDDDKDKEGGLSCEDLEKLPECAYGRGEACGGDGSEECRICLERLREGDRCRFLEGCRHGFHRECVDLWLARKATCPACRAPVEVPQSGEEGGVEWTWLPSPLGWF